ncbi:MAG: glycosyltransferase [Bacteroidia bacterium]|nr:glycosyltransferase [Bacteroidia bacterium]
MVKRLKIALIYNYNESWIGGTYYIVNIIRLLNNLSFYQKPIVYLIFDNDKELELIKSINYPYLKLKSKYIDLYSLKGLNELTFFEKVVNKFSSKIFNKHLFTSKSWVKQIDVLFPSDFDPIYDQVRNKVFWIPDFQNKYLKDFFDEIELREREVWCEKISNQKHLFLSSFSSFNDFEKFYPNKTIQKYVYSFVSIQPDFNLLGLDELKNKYKIGNSRFFFVANQFWQHKNHINVLKAINYLKQKSLLNFDVYFSGKQSDYRNKNYFNDILSYVHDYNLTDNVFFLGFIDRNDQLSFMKHSISVIQPSLFEGWSTVIEDAKMLNKIVVCSNINVHKEQLKNQAYYFDPYDYVNLAEHLQKLNLNSEIEIDYNYLKSINQTSKQLFKTLAEISRG